jgi:hypothetical protein
VTVPWSSWTLPAALVAIWLVGWWRGSRRFRLWFALLAPAAAVAGLVLGVLAALEEADTPRGADVAQWAASVDGSSGFGTWLSGNSWHAVVVAVPLTVLTLIIEYVLLVLRDSGRDRQPGRRP